MQHGHDLALVLFPLAVAIASQDRASSRWTDIAPPAAGFSVQAPGEPKPDPKNPGRYGYVVGDTSFTVEVAPLDGAIQQAMARGDDRTVTKYLESIRDGILHLRQATARASSFAGFDGHPSVLLSFGGEIDKRLYEGSERIVLAPERMYLVIAIGPKTELKNADVERFLGSFRLAKVAPAAATDQVFRTVRFKDLVCGNSVAFADPRAQIPAMPVAFEMPADFIPRPVGPSAEGGCLWGTKDDLDRVTADPEQGDFTDLRRGVFRARMSLGVVCSQLTGSFDQMDGTGEAGIRRSLERMGAKVIVWKKQRRRRLGALRGRDQERGRGTPIQPSSGRGSPERRGSSVSECLASLAPAVRPCRPYAGSTEFCGSRSCPG